MMRPKTTREDLPTRSTVRTNIKNKFVDYVQSILTSIRAAPGDVCPNWDLWSEEHASLAFFGMMVQWIDVKGDVWKLRVGVAAFHKISGDHSGKNLGRYFIKFTDRVGITSKTLPNKVSILRAVLPVRS